MALAADPANLPIFVKNLTDPDAGMRWWAINGLKNLGSKAKSAQKQILHAAQHDALRKSASWPPGSCTTSATRMLTGK